MVADLAEIVPLPATFVDNAAAVFDPLAGEAPLVRIVRTMRGVAVVAVAEPLVDEVRESLAAQGLSAVDVAVAEDPGTRAQCLAVVVCTPQLLEARCNSVEQMRLVNALCQFVELAEGA